MTDLGVKTGLAKALFGRRGQADQAVRRIVAEAAADSEDGTVAVKIGGETIEVPTTGSASEGDTVIVDVEGGAAVAYGSVGWGDRVYTDVSGLQTLIRETADGVLVCKVGQPVGAMVWASGGFDVVNVTWADGVPTVGESITYMGAGTVRVGKVTEPHVEIGNKVIAASDGVDTIMSASLLATDEYDWSGDSTLLPNGEIIVGYGYRVPENGWEWVGMAVVGDQLQPLPNGAEFSCTDPYYVPVVGSVGYYAVNWMMSNQTGSDLYYTVIQAVKSGFRYGTGFAITPTGDVECESIEVGGVDVSSELSTLDSRTDALEAARQSGTLDNTFKNLAIKNDATHIATLTSGSGTLVYIAAAYAGNIVLTQIAGSATSAWSAVSSGLTLGLYSTDRVSTWAVCELS